MLKCHALEEESMSNYHKKCPCTINCHNLNSTGRQVSDNYIYIYTYIYTTGYKLDILVRYMNTSVKASLRTHKLSQHSSRLYILILIKPFKTHRKFLSTGLVMTILVAYAFKLDLSPT